MKQFLLLAALLLTVNFAHAGIDAAACPAGSETLLTCDAVADRVVASAAVCLKNGKVSIQLEIKGTSNPVVLTDAREMVRNGSSFYVGPDYVLSRFPSNTNINGSLEISGHPAVKLSCK